MKRAVSISLGSSARNKAVEIELLGESIRIERIGTDGDMHKAADLFGQLDGEVDAFGVGGADLGLEVAGRWYPLHSVRPMVRQVRRTPIVDGTGLKNTLEARLAGVIEQHIPEAARPKRALITSGADRWGMTLSFFEAGYDCVFGDLMFALGVPIPLRHPRQLKTLARFVVPVVSRLPFSWLYPTGGEQDKRVPKWGRYYAWATVIAGDCHYVKRHMPEKLEGKIVATNTTTDDDVALFRAAGVRYLVTSTPVLQGRSFGTNMMEAALVAIAGKGRPLSRAELVEMLPRAGLEPQLISLQ